MNQGATLQAAKIRINGQCASGHSRNLEFVVMDVPTNLAQDCYYWLESLCYLRRA
jgi:hypothetical protein